MQAFGRPFVKRFALCYRTVACLSCLPVCDVGVLSPKDVWIKMKLGMQVGLGPGHNALDGVQLPKKGAEPPIFVPCLLKSNGWMDQNGSRHGGGTRRRRHCVTWGPGSPPQKGHCSPQFSAHVCCGQTAVCIWILLGTEVGLSLGDIELDGDPGPSSPSPRVAQAPVLVPRLLWPNGRPPRLLLSTCFAHAQSGND